ncbi:hypothetical protein FRC05_010274 [Tulasnella sp. 425]|nr:hypothetical protein FRC05_010274 [Tulasnella sp. 425]
MEGKIYDNPDPSFVIPHIEAFIQAYDLKVDDLLEPDIKRYKVRWIKGQESTLPTLLDDKHLAETFGKNPSIAIFRLAPQDYHRYHAPFKAKLGEMFHVPGTYFTVNPQAINEGLDVFTANRRGAQLLQAGVRNPTFTAATAATTSTNTPQKPPPKPVTFGLVAVGALLVGSIGWSKNPGDGVMKREDLGFFQYGGSTVILVAPEGTVEWDEDLVANSSGLTGLTGVESGRPVETLVRVGERIEKVVG